jgi:hypothetical protein
MSFWIVPVVHKQAKNKQEVLERTNLPTFLTLFKNVICIKTSICPNITLMGNSVLTLKHYHIQNNVSIKKTVRSSWSFTILNFNCVGTTANSCISGSRNFIIFLYFIHLRWKLNSLQRYDIAQNYRILHAVVQIYHKITSTFRTIAIFKNCVKQNNDSNKTYRYVHDLLLY